MANNHDLNLKREIILLTFATCSKDNLSELLQTCESVKNFTTVFNLNVVVFEHILILSNYNKSQIELLKDTLSSYNDYYIKSKVIETSPKGISSAFNTALEVAQGSYIMFLNAGDKINCNSEGIDSFNQIIRNFFLEKQLNSKSVYYFDIITSGRTKLFNRRVSYPNKLNPYHFLKMGNPINHQSTLYPLQLAKGYPYPIMPVGMDYSVNLSMIFNGVEFHKLPGVLIEYDITGISAKKPFQRLYINFKTLTLKAIKHHALNLVIICWMMLPILLLRSAIQKITYFLR